MKILKCIALVLLAAMGWPALASDGYPVGYSTPEGAACEFARAFIRRDAKLFDKSVLPPFGDGQSRANYGSFLAETRSSIVEESKRPADRGPKIITQVFSARALSKSGPASYAYVAFDFVEVKFVDVVVRLHEGDVATNRTLVVKDEVGQWRVHPAPDIHPLMSAGLNDETPSTAELPHKGPAK